MSVGLRHKDHRSSTPFCECTPADENNLQFNFPVTIFSLSFWIQKNWHEDCMNWTLATAVAMAVLVKWRKRTDDWL